MTWKSCDGASCGRERGAGRAELPGSGRQGRGPGTGTRRSVVSAVWEAAEAGAAFHSGTKRKQQIEFS